MHAARFTTFLTVGLCGLGRQARSRWHRLLAYAAVSPVSLEIHEGVLLAVAAVVGIDYLLRLQMAVLRSHLAWRTA